MPGRNVKHNLLSLSLPTLKHNNELEKSVCDANSAGINMQHKIQMLEERRDMMEKETVL